MIPLFLTENIDASDSRYYLWPLIPKNSLVVREIIFPMINDISDLRKILPDTNGQPIYLDLSENPEVLDTPHAINVFNRLKEVAPLKILVNDYKKFYTPHQDFVFYPVFFYAYSHETYINKHTFCDFPNFEQKTKFFMSLNNRAIWHRIWLFTELASNNLLDKLEFSFIWDPKEHQHNHLDQLPEHKYIQAMSLLDQLPIKLSDEQTGHFVRTTVVPGPRCYRECAVNIVTESCPNLGFLTEKICKALACYQIPILLSHAGATQFCVDAGFDMFEDIIPWRSWDSIEDEQHRCAVACKFIVDYIKHGNALADWNKSQDRVIANRKRLVSDDFKKFCISQFDF